MLVSKHEIKQRL